MFCFGYCCTPWVCGFILFISSGTFSAIIFNFFVILFIHVWLCWVSVAAQAFSLAAASGGCSPVVVWGLLVAVALLLQSMSSRCKGFRGCGTWLRGSGSRALERRLSSCGPRAWLLCSMWNFPRPGVEPALAGKFFTIEPSGKPSLFLKCYFCFIVFTFYF